ncbi:hypothetical protein H4219_001089 [Mycoemilia scoparia]|uniref:F-box domain-containing protein n=1 Tax=Mycoemilia scoparia TaxID=417184 RepID=A0A9W8DW91_9FUNG|nr:hypothetical protein H4219_001089 [Mycoemilia scoparia]
MDPSAITFNNIPLECKLKICQYIDPWIHEETLDALAAFNSSWNTAVLYTRWEYHQYPEFIPNDIFSATYSKTLKKRERVHVNFTRNGTQYVKRMKISDPSVLNRLVGTNKFPLLKELDVSCVNIGRGEKALTDLAINNQNIHKLKVTSKQQGMPNAMPMDLINNKRNSLFRPIEAMSSNLASITLEVSIPFSNIHSLLALVPKLQHLRVDTCSLQNICDTFEYGSNCFDAKKMNDQNTYDPLDSSSISGIMALMSPHQNLESLDIKEIKIDTNSYVYKAFDYYASLPPLPKLKDLGLPKFSSYVADSGSHEAVQNITWAPFTDHHAASLAGHSKESLIQWSPKLRSLRLRSFTPNYASSIVQCCPNLESLFLDIKVVESDLPLLINGIQILAKGLNKLQALKIGQFEPLAPLNQDLSSLFTWSGKSSQSADIQSPNASKQGISKNLAFAGSLKLLDIQNFAVSPTILTSLGQFQNLEVLKIQFSTLENIDSIGSIEKEETDAIKSIFPNLTQIVINNNVQLNTTITEKQLQKFLSLFPNLSQTRLSLNNSLIDAMMFQFPHVHFLVPECSAKMYLWNL